MVANTVPIPLAELAKLVADTEIFLSETEVLLDCNLIDEKVLFRDVLNDYLGARTSGYFYAHYFMRDKVAQYLNAAGGMAGTW